MPSILKLMTRHARGAGTLLLLIAATFALGACSIKLVGDYDGATYEEILRTGKKVDKFYGDLLETPSAERQYRKYADRYVEIETDLRSLYVRNRARPLNAESAEIAEIVLDLWVKYKTGHAAKDGYGDGAARLDRARFTRLFISAADAESAKKLSIQDKTGDSE